MKRINSMKKRRRKEVTVSDRSLASVGPACPVSDAQGPVWSALTYTDVLAREPAVTHGRRRRLDAGAESGQVEPDASSHHLVLSTPL
jgi:hypothetical protein